MCLERQQSRDAHRCLPFVNVYPPKPETLGVGLDEAQEPKLNPSPHLHDRELGTWAITCSLVSAHYQEARIRRGARTLTRRSNTGCGFFTAGQSTVMKEAMLSPRITVKEWRQLIYKGHIQPLCAEGSELMWQPRTLNFWEVMKVKAI